MKPEWIEIQERKDSEGVKDYPLRSWVDESIGAYSWGLEDSFLKTLVAAVYGKNEPVVQEFFLRGFFLKSSPRPNGGMVIYVMKNGDDGEQNTVASLIYRKKSVRTLSERLKVMMDHLVFEVSEKGKKFDKGGKNESRHKYRDTKTPLIIRPLFQGKTTEDYSPKV